ncbi:MAG: hypothetical protein HFH84_03020 [Lachnospiraceae bacterium]|nr:hypothetical protein [Lachnospiraceae bacterium]
MSDITMEQKLRLVQQVRSRYHENQYDLSNREQILYGKTSAGLQNEDALRYGEPYYENTVRPEEASFSFLKFRMWIALFLVTAVIVMDRNHMEVAGITAEKIFEVISADYEEVIETWAEALTGAPSGQQGNVSR